MNKLFIAASAAALLTAAGAVPSFAQSSTTGASSATMPSITCRDLSAMDPQMAKNVVFYLGGLNASMSSSSAMNSTTGSGSSSTTADAGSSGSTTTTTGSSDTSGSGSSSTTADSGTTGSSGSGSSDATGSTTAAGSSGSSGSSSSGSSGASSTVVAQLPGFAMIDADKVISTCQSSPDMQLSTVLGTSTTAQ